MGDGVSIVGFQDVDDVPGALVAAEAVLRDLGVVAGAYDPEAILAARHGRVLRPAPGAGAMTGYGEGLLTLLTNGVAFEGPGYFNAYAIGFAEWLECPVCRGRMDDGDGRLGDQVNNLGMAAADWCDGQRDAVAACLVCGAAPRVTDWIMADPVFLADVAVEFWNWPYLDTDNRPDGVWWKIDVITPLEQAVGRPALISGYKI